MMSRKPESILPVASHLNRRRLLTWLAVGSVALTGCSAMKAANLQAPEIRVRNVTLGNLDLSGLEVLVDLRLRNPNDLTLPITGIEYNLVLDGTRVADGRQAKAVTLPALGEADLQLSMNVNLFKSAMRLVPKLMNPTKPVKSMHYQVGGSVKLDWWYLPSLPFSREGDLPLQIQ